MDGNETQTYTVQADFLIDFSVKICYDTESSVLLRRKQDYDSEKF
jgi:hypothetical protein